MIQISDMTASDMIAYQYIEYIKDYLLSVHTSNEKWEMIINYVLTCSVNNLQPFELQQYPELLIYIDSKWQEAILNILMLNCYVNDTYIPMQSEWELLIGSSQLVTVRTKTLDFNNLVIDEFFK